MRRNCIRSALALALIVLLVFVVVTNPVDEGSGQRLTQTWYNYSNHRNSTGTAAPADRWLIVQHHSGRRAYMDLVEASGRVNRAYARHHGIDYLIATGVAFQTRQLLSGGSRAGDGTYNKLEILRGLLREGRYHKLLLMDADAMLVDMDWDLRTESPLGEHLLSAQKDHPRKSDSTAFINAGVIFWNLQHTYANKVSSAWCYATSWYRWIGLPPDDQTPLQFVLAFYGDEERARIVASYTDIGSHLIHVVRAEVEGNSWSQSGTAVEKRLKIITNEASRVCRKWKGSCDDL